MRTNAGRDWQAAQMGGTPGAAANYIGLTNDNTAPAAGDTTLTGEIAAGTLARALATYAHTTGTATYTLTKTYTADQTVVIRKIGVFPGAGAVPLVFESLLNADGSVISGDQITITETVNL